MHLESKQDLSKADSYFITDLVTIEDEKVLLKRELKNLVQEQSGWLLSITDQGDVIGAFNIKGAIPEKLTESEIASMIYGDRSDDEQYTYWEVGEQPYYVLFGKIRPEEKHLEQIIPSVDWKQQKLNLSSNLQTELEREKGWVQLINTEGNVLDSYGNVEKKRYTVKTLFRLTEHETQSTVSYLDPNSGLTLLVGSSNENKSQIFEKNMFDRMMKSFLVITAVALLLLLASTFWYARKFGVPLMALMKWIQNLGSGLYYEPVDTHGQLITRTKKGKLRRKFRLYKELILTLSQLTEILRNNEKQQRMIAQTREEWISGLSHDLKTPLSSISGYAQMLASNDYSWSEKETKDFAKIMAEKSEYMMDLLEDLTLTYRLKNNALPITKVPTDLNEFIRRTIIHYINDPVNHERSFQFKPHSEPIIGSIDPKWFQRILDNIIANAIHYNSPETTISVTLTCLEDRLVVIKIEDNGKGMDNDTLRKLFSRYYRGRNTGETDNGSGLGMAITKQLVLLHEGTINVQSELGKGTVFRIILPIK